MPQRLVQYLKFRHYWIAVFDIQRLPAGLSIWPYIGLINVNGAAKVHEHYQRKASEKRNQHLTVAAE